MNFPNAPESRRSSYQITLADGSSREMLVGFVRKKMFATCCLLLAWLCATGAVCDVAQLFAWGRMFAGYARVLSVREALTETFDANKPCELCLAVKKTRTSEEGQPRAAEFSAEKLLLACATTADTELVPIAPANHWPLALDWNATGRVDPVPVPPPRA